MPRWHVGIDIGGTWVRVLASGESGERGQVIVAPTPTSYGALLDEVEQLVATAAGGPLARVACGLPGTSDAERPTFVPAVRWIERQPLQYNLAMRLGCPVLLGLDGQLSLLGEALEGAAVGRQSAVLVAVGTGIGGAVMIGGRIWRGHHGSAGSWGWLPADGGRADPNHGRFEQVASGRALATLASDRAAAGSAPDLVEAARRGEAAAVAVLDEYAGMLGSGLASIASTLDPEIVVIAGGLSAAMDVLGPPLARAVRRFASPHGRCVTVRAAALGPHAGVVGALLLAEQGERVWS